jgi:hypothetical protein
MPKLLSIIGALVICAGLDLLWQSRHELRFWFSAYRKLFFALFRLGEPLRFFPIKEVAQRRHSAVRFLLGLGFAFVLGPMLIALGVTLVLYTKL